MNVRVNSISYQVHLTDATVGAITKDLFDRLVRRIGQDVCITIQTIPPKKKRKAG